MSEFSSPYALWGLTSEGFSSSGEETALHGCKVQALVGEEEAIV